MVLVNGAEGIGTGFSTSIPCYNPKEIIHNIFNIMDNKKVKLMSPWYKNYRGKIIKVDDNTYDTYGNYDILDSNRIIINELPLGSWTTPYKELLETIQYDSDSKKWTEHFRFACQQPGFVPIGSYKGKVVVSGSKFSPSGDLIEENDTNALYFYDMATKEFSEKLYQDPSKNMSLNPINEEYFYDKNYKNLDTEDVKYEMEQAVNRMEDY